MVKGKKVNSINTVGLMIRPTIDHDSVVLISNLLGWLCRRKKKVILSADKLGQITPLMKKAYSTISTGSEKEILTKTDLIIVLGGDGTFISTARKATKPKIPILGINLGTLGFTTEFSKAELYDALEKVLKGNYSTYKLNLFSTKIMKGGNVTRELFFVNDAVVGRKDVSRLISLSLNTNDENIYNLKGDGLIISSPLGSTAYSLAAGGPIIHPDSKSIVITPICPHSLNFRPIVLPNETELRINPYENEETIQLTLDGQEALEIDKETVISISKSKKKPIEIIKNDEKNFFLTLRNKFTLGKK